MGNYPTTIHAVRVIGNHFVGCRGGKCRAGLVGFSCPTLFLPAASPAAHILTILKKRLKHPRLVASCPLDWLRVRHTECADLERLLGNRAPCEPFSICRQVFSLPTYPPFPNRALNAALAKIPRSMGPAPVERSRLSSYPPGKERFSRPRPEMSHRLARSEAATLPGLLRRLEFAGRALPRNSRPVSEAQGQAGSVRPRNVPFEGDLGGLGRRRLAFIG